MKRAITSFDKKELSEYFETQGEKKFRLKQVLEWLYEKNAFSWDEMSNLSKKLREKLSAEFSICSLEIEEAVSSGRDSSAKYLFCTHDGHLIESVLIPARNRMTVCVSTQIGCKFACAFCASGSNGFVRDLSTGEIVDQVRLIQKDIGERISNIVFMGMGEPLDNYDNTLRSIRILTAEWGLNIGMRHITVSTVGIVPGIERLADEGLSRIKLSVSLHAPSQQKRHRLMPVAGKYPLSELLSALDDAKDNFKRKITLEYTLLKGVNDLAQDADKLTKIAGRLAAKVNIIVYNPVKGTPFEVSDEETVSMFTDRLEASGIPVTVRRSAGDEITAACGQLRLRDSQK